MSDNLTVDDSEVITNPGMSHHTEQPGQRTGYGVAVDPGHSERRDNEVADDLYILHID